MLSTPVSTSAILFQDGHFYTCATGIPADTSQPLGDTTPWFDDRILELDAASGSLCVVDPAVAGLRSSTITLKPGEVFFSNKGILQTSSLEDFNRVVLN